MINLMKKLFRLPILCVFAASLIFGSCAKDENDDNNLIPVASQKVSTTVAGRLVDEAGEPVVGATVMLEGRITFSDPMGLFLFKNIMVTGSRGVVNCTKAGYIQQLYGFRPSPGKVSFVKPVMLSHALSQIISSATGGIVTLPSGGSVEFPANAFSTESGAPYTGNVTVNFVLLNKDDAKFKTKIPGRDLIAKDRQGALVILDSYGMLNVELLSTASQKLNLAAGKKATLTFPVIASQQSSAPSSIPLWHLNTVNGMWNEEGTALRSGNTYTAQVSHFTWWNCDVPYSLANVSGLVLSCGGTPVPNMDVFVEGNYGYITDNTGHFAGPTAAQYGMVDIYAAYYDISQTEYIPNLASGQLFVVPDLIMTSASSIVLSGSITDCNGNPSDGFIVFYDAANNYYEYVYVTGGTYSLIAENNTTYEITAMNNGLYGQTTYTTNASNWCNPPVLPAISICNSLGGGTNFTATLSSPIIGTQILGYNVTSCIAGTTPSPYIYLNATDSLNNSTGNFNLKVTSYAPGTYAWNLTTSGITFNATLNGLPVVMNSQPGGYTTVVTAPATGGMVQVNYNGTVLISSPQYSVPIPATISGAFNVMRN